MPETPSVRRSLGIVTVTKFLAFLLGLLTVVIVSRILSPYEIGVFSVSASLIGFAHVFREFGVGQYLLQVPEITRERRRAAFTVTLLISWSIATILYASRSLATYFYRDPGIEQVISLLAINFILLPFATPLRSQLQRDMQFKRIAIADLSNHCISAAATIVAAWTGMSYKSMAIGAIAGNLAGLAALVAISPKGALDWPTRHGLRDVFRFGSYSSVATLSAEVGTAAPDIILGRTLGFSDVAYFSRANGLLSMALGQLRGVVQSVIVPVFAKGRREGVNLSDLYTKYSALYLAVVLPVLAVLALLSRPLIEFMFGVQWTRSAPLGTMLCIFSMITGPVMLAPYILVASGNVRTLMRSRIALVSIKVLVLLSSFFLSLEGVVLSFLIVYIFEFIIFQNALRACLGIKGKELWKGLRTSALLVPLTVALPTLALFATAGIGIHTPLIELAIGGSLAVVSWTAALFAVRHPLHLEISAIAAKAGNLVGRQKKSN